MYRFVYFFLAITVVLYSCKQKIDPQLVLLDESFIHNNLAIEQSNYRIYTNLKEMLQDPQRVAKARIWQPKAESVRKFSLAVKEYIDSLAIALRQENGTVYSEWIKHNGQRELFKRLLDFKRNIIDVLDTSGLSDNPFWVEEIEKRRGQMNAQMPLLHGLQDSIVSTGKIDRWLDSNFSAGNRQLSLVMLNKIKNDVLLSEKNLIDYCYINVPSYSDAYSPFQGVAFLSSNQVKRGEQVSIIAGTGSFSSDLRARYIINNNVVKLNDNAIAFYQFVANGKPGKHDVIVRAMYTLPDGSPATVDRRLTYTIVE